MPYHVETVRIVSPISADNPHGFIVINKSDFDAKKHVEWPPKKTKLTAVPKDPKIAGLNPSYVAPLFKPAEVK